MNASTAERCGMEAWGLADAARGRIILCPLQGGSGIYPFQRAADRNLHRKRGSVSGSRQPEDQHYYHEMVIALAGAAEILIVGPGQAKLELIKHIHSHDQGVSDKVIGVETVDHPSAGRRIAR